MQDNIRGKKNASIICATVLIGILAVWLATIIFPLIRLCLGETVAVLILIIYALVICAVIVGILLALWQRLHEIEGGEEEEATKY